MNTKQIDEQRLKRIAAAPGRATMDDVVALVTEVERLRGDDFIPHDSGEKCISCDRLASRQTYPYCALCAVRLQLEYANNELERIDRISIFH